MIKKTFLLSVLIFLVTCGMLSYSDNVSAQKGAIRNIAPTPLAPSTTTPQTLPFSQNWTNVGLITANDDWSAVPGVTGYLGNWDAGAVTNTDPRTLLTPFATNDVDVIANQANATSISGGVAEIDGIANPIVALQGSGTADAPSIVYYLNTTGFTNIQFACNIRDVDDTVDNAAQQVDVQYRVGGTGDYTSVTGGYIADASAGPSLTMSTPLNLSLPAAANNQALVEVRIITTNAAGSDEWVGPDDVVVTGTGGGGGVSKANVDMNNDNRTDYVVIRTTGSALAEAINKGDVPARGFAGRRERLKFYKEHPEALAVPQLTAAYWYILLNGPNTVTAAQWGDADTDIVLPEDFDGDGRDDIAVYRQGVGGVAGFYIFQSQTHTVRILLHGENGHDPSVSADYDGDNKADPATYSCPPTTPGQCYYEFIGSQSNPGNTVTYVPWGFGTIGDFFPNVGDFDNDGRADFCIQRTNPSAPGQGQFALLKNPSLAAEFINWGADTDFIVPGDYDGDDRADFMVMRSVSGSWRFFLLTRSNTTSVSNWGSSATDVPAPGDYDGDNKTDLAVYRLTAPPNPNRFFVWNSGSNTASVVGWGNCAGSPCDSPAAVWQVQ